MSDKGDIRELLRRYRHGERPALNRLVSFVSRGDGIDLIRDELQDGSHESPLIAITGNSGVGKSTLLGRLIEHVRSLDETIAILACDPESALTGGALLGDRVRMSSHAGDEGVWIRSLASASGQQAVVDHLDLIAQLLTQFGFDHVILETVGAGQGDVAVESIADLVVLLIQPEIGDELQWEKAGVLEVADVVVVHKGDLPGAERTEAQARDLLNLPGCEQTPVVRVSSKTGEGIAELWSLLVNRPQRDLTTGRNTRRLLRLVQQRIATWFAFHPDEVESIVQGCSSSGMTNEQTITRILSHLTNDHS
ncbi:MAG: hypothetical protein KDA93_16795 [Planctomycetaceae bacterium]|nr:hypothetical protein [Planctomycetaceae bacterium]